MTRFELETWDSGKLTVNSAFAELLQRHAWMTFSKIWEMTADAAVAKNLRTDRVTLSFSLDDQGTERRFYIKRHSRSSLKEYLKPLLRLTWPILGARNEWNALLEFHHAGIPTMIPVALGVSGSNSFLITESLENCVKLSAVCNLDGNPDFPSVDRNRLIREIATIARRMHAEGMHHQDFYLGHLLLSREPSGELYLIDLGRVRKHKHLSQRWIIKDLAQLNYSAATATTAERLRFLREYLGRRLQPQDRKLISQIEFKTTLISRHSRRNRL